jgi:hypothetical protein
MRIILLTAVLTVSVFAQRRSAPAPAAAAPAFRAHPTPVTPSRPAAPSRPIAPRPVTPAPYRYPPRTVLIPYPVYVGGGYTSGYIAQPDPAPVAYVNPNYQPDVVNPQIIDYSYATLPEPASPDAADNTTPLRDDQPTVFLIALTDHTVLASIAYWVDGDVLNWVSRDAKQNRISLALVDRDFSKQLNDERHVEFKLPSPQ